MPDVLEMPYRPEVAGAGFPGARAHNYRLAGPTCLAGDVIGDYSFDRPLVPGDRLVFGDMAILTMVKKQHLQRHQPAVHLHPQNRTAPLRLSKPSDTKTSRAVCLDKRP
jgi:carboxynorspermidine decarboxylase